MPKIRRRTLNGVTLLVILLVVRRPGQGFGGKCRSVRFLFFFLPIIQLVEIEQVGVPALALLAYFDEPVLIIKERARVRGESHCLLHMKRLCGGAANSH